jgi:hypothetical protein
MAELRGWTTGRLVTGRRESKENELAFLRLRVAFPRELNEAV